MPVQEPQVIENTVPILCVRDIKTSVKYYGELGRHLYLGRPRRQWLLPMRGRAGVPRNMGVGRGA